MAARVQRKSFPGVSKDVSLEQLGRIRSKTKVGKCCKNRQSCLLAEAMGSEETVLTNQILLEVRGHVLMDIGPPIDHIPVILTLRVIAGA